MPLSQFVAVGSNTNIKTGAGRLYGVVIGGANGGTFIAQDSVSIGATPNYVAMGVSVASNLAYVSGLPATPMQFDFRATPFTNGLTVAATSNAPLTVSYD